MQLRAASLGASAVRLRSSARRSVRWGGGYSLWCTSEVGTAPYPPRRGPDRSGVDGAVRRPVLGSVDGDVRAVDAGRPWAEQEAGRVDHLLEAHEPATGEVLCHEP